MKSSLSANHRPWHIQQILTKRSAGGFCGDVLEADVDQIPLYNNGDETLFPGTAPLKQRNVPEADGEVRCLHNKVVM